jgi:DNA repair photolyase
MCIKRNSAKPGGPLKRSPNVGDGSSAAPGEASRGRGALSNRAGRFEANEIDPFDDGWPGGEGEAMQGAPTHFYAESTKRALSRNESPDLDFDRSINPYRGCEHGCVYCFARPTHEYLGYSAGLDFETRITVKPDVPARLREELMSPRYTCMPIALGTNTDCYQPGERSHRITRQILELLSETNHPVGIVTKSALVLRDVDILASMAERNLAKVHVSVTSLRADIARTLEPRAAAPHRRLRVLRELAEAGVPTGVMVAPVIPGLTDEEMEDIIAAAADAGARCASYLLLRLPGEVDELFREWLERHEPGRAKKVISYLDALHDVERGGSRGGSGFGVRHRGRGAYADLLRWRFSGVCRRAGLSARSPALDITRFRAPEKNRSQLRLFDPD